MYQKLLDVSIWLFALLALLGALLLVSWNTAGGQSPEPTPQCTPVGDDTVWCLLPEPVAITATPTETTVPPTVQSTLTPFEPTSTTSPLPHTDEHTATPAYNPTDTDSCG